MTKKYSPLIIIIILGLLVSSCSTVKKAFDPQRKNGSEEFLVEKKSPLSMPPEFDKLPIPQNSSQKEKNESLDIKQLIIEQNLTGTELDKVDNSDSNFEDILLNKIK